MITKPQCDVCKQEADTTEIWQDIFENYSNCVSSHKAESIADDHSKWYKNADDWCNSCFETYLNQGGSND